MSNAVIESRIDGWLDEFKWSVANDINGMPRPDGTIEFPNGESDRTKGARRWILEAFAKRAARIDELEAKLVAFTQAIDAQREWNEQPHDCDSLPEHSLVPCAACEEMVRQHTAELVSEQQLLALGREIANRRPR